MEFWENRYGTLIETFTNGCLVIASMPDGYEIAITCPGQAFPIRTLQDPNTGKAIVFGSRLEAEERAKILVKRIKETYGLTLPSNIAVNSD